jgi:hypothetical protein
VKKWANELNFFKGRSRYGQKNTWRNVQYPWVQRKCKSKPLRFHLIPIKWQSSRIQTANVGEDVGKKEPSYTVSGNAN